MLIPPADVLAAGLPSLAAALRPPGLEAAAVARLKAAPPAFPVCGIEVRLGSGDPRIDFAAAVSAVGPGRAVLARSELADPSWQRGARFARAWGMPASALDRRVSVLFCELDDLGGDPSPPGWFARLDPPPRAGDADLGAATAALFDDVVVPLLGCVRDDASVRRVAACIEEAGPHGRLLHVGGLPHRDPGAVRLVFTVHQDDVYSFLLGVGVPLEIEGLRTLDHLLERAPDWLDLHVDVKGDAVGSRVGVEFSFGGRAPEDPRWEVVLDRWAAAGWAEPGRCAAALAWPGTGRHPSLSGGALRRELSHVKVAIDGARPPKAKAYLSLEAGLPGVI